MLASAYASFKSYNVQENIFYVDATSSKLVTGREW